MKGGYLIFDMCGISVENGGTAQGLYNLIESSYNKPAIITNTVDVDGNLRNDEYVLYYTKSTECTITTSNYIFTVANDDTVTVKKNEGGGVKLGYFKTQFTIGETTTNLFIPIINVGGTVKGDQGTGAKMAPFTMSKKALGEAGLIEGKMFGVTVGFLNVLANINENTNNYGIAIEIDGKSQSSKAGDLSIDSNAFIVLVIGNDGKIYMAGFTETTTIVTTEHLLDTTMTVTNMSQYGVTI